MPSKRKRRALIFVLAYRNGLINVDSMPASTYSRKAIQNISRNASGGLLSIDGAGEPLVSIRELRHSRATPAGDIKPNTYVSIQIFRSSKHSHLLYGACSIFDSGSFSNRWDFSNCINFLPNVLDEPHGCLARSLRSRIRDKHPCWL